MSDQPDSGEQNDDLEGIGDAIEAEIDAQGGPFQAPVGPDVNLPEQLIALPLNQRPVFPSMMLPLVIPNGLLSDAVKVAIDQHEGFIGFFMTRELLENGDEYRFDQLHTTGSVARVLKAEQSGDAGMQVLVHILARFQAEAVTKEKPFVIVQGAPVRPKVDAQDPEVRAYTLAIVSALKELVTHNPVFADEIKMVLANFNNMDGPGRLADLAASLTTAKREEIQQVLDCYPVVPRMRLVLDLLAKETQISEMKSKIQSQINDKVDEHQRKFFLHEHLKAIKSELGLETDEKSLEINRFQEQFDAKKDAMSSEVVQATEDELRKLTLLDPSSSEYGVSRNRLEWLVGMPWGAASEDQLNLLSMREGLDADHYGLDDIKDRIIEFVAVRRLNQERGGGIICLVGPPGTGKTSIGASIARHLGRTFYRLSVGGMRDEAEIKGHRRTYVGALPGKLVQALRRCEAMNPVILLDEIDKLGRGMQGDPASALLEVLDPEQNKDFLDHYLDVRVDLSQVLFICTANDVSGIPEPLHDRMELIRLAGYIEDEKVMIGHKYLVPKQRKAHGLSSKDINLGKRSVRHIVRDYAREAGVRRLEQLIAKCCRKVATAKASWLSEHDDSDQSAPPFDRVTITPDDLTDYLGKRYLSDEELMPAPTPGVVTGLAWTALGGATLEIEAVAIPAKQGGFQLSGQLGDVMKESAELARSYLRAQAERYGIAEDYFDRHIIHLHVPAGATPKDGPSAGITMATAMLSLAQGQPVRAKLGMTGELTLTGRVYPIGGVREKTVAAKRAGLKTIILPRANERDWAELPDHLRRGVSVHFVDQLDEVLALVGLR